MYNIDEILKLVFEIPKQSWDYVNYKVIDNILKNGSLKKIMYLNVVQLQSD